MEVFLFIIQFLELTFNNFFNFISVSVPNKVLFSYIISDAKMNRCRHLTQLTNLQISNEIEFYEIISPTFVLVKWRQTNNNISSMYDDDDNGNDDEANKLTHLKCLMNLRSKEQRQHFKRKNLCRSKYLQSTFIYFSVDCLFEPQSNENQFINLNIVYNVDFKHFSAFNNNVNIYQPTQSSLAGSENRTEKAILLEIQISAVWIT